MVAGCQAQVDHSQRERKPFDGHKLKVGKTPKVVSIASRERCALSLKQGNSTYLNFLSTWGPGAADPRRGVAACTVTRFDAGAPQARFRPGLRFRCRRWRSPACGCAATPTTSAFSSSRPRADHITSTRQAPAEASSRAASAPTRLLPPLGPLPPSAPGRWRGDLRGKPLVARLLL